MDEIKHVEKKIRKYVIITVSHPFAYLYKKPAHQEYYFFNNIEKATKFLNKKDAEETIFMYYRFTNDTKLDLVVVPIDITYELIEEKGL